MQYFISSKCCLFEQKLLFVYDHGPETEPLIGEKGKSSSGSERSNHHQSTLYPPHMTLNVNTVSNKTNLSTVALDQ